MSKYVSPVWARKIKQEAAKLKADENHLHNKTIHAEILAAWEQHSPTMWRRLEQANLADPLAMVLQARMWGRKHELMKSGMPVTDAREVAERELLMLEPEAEAASDRLESLSL